MSVARPRAKLEKINVTKSYAALASVIREKILDGDLAPGTALADERTLVEETGLSRGSVREALRVLEAEGLVATSLGRYGASVVQSGTSDAFRRTVDVFIRHKRIPFSTLLETRQMLEPALAMLAAKHRTPEDIAMLVKATEALESAAELDALQFAQCNVDWHLAVAEASHNELLIAFMHAIASAFRNASTLESHGSEEIFDSMIRAHRGILKAIVDGDHAAAQRRMLRHLGAYEETLGHVAPQTVETDEQAKSAQAAPRAARAPRVSRVPRT